VAYRPGDKKDYLVFYNVYCIRRHALFYLVSYNTLKKILLIHPPSFSSLNWSGQIEANKENEHEIELGLLYIAAFLIHNNIEVRYVDMTMQSRDELYRILSDESFSLVGLTAYTNSIHTAADIAHFIKQNFKIPIVIGGPHASALPVKTMEDFPVFDFLIYGEGEVTMSEMLLKPPDRIKGLLWRNGEEIIQNEPREPIFNLDDIPFPARSITDYKRYIPTPGNYRQLPSTGILSSRGCPYLCTFCARYASRDKHKVRYRSIANLMDEIHACLSYLGIKDFRFYDDTFTANRSRLYEFCERILKDRIKLTWNCFGRVDRLDFESFRLMKRAGCYHIKFGIEFGTQKWLDKTKKGTTLDQARKTVREAKRAGLETKCSFILGMPGETLEEINQTIAFAKELNPHYATFGIFTPLPGSEIYQDAFNSGDLLTTDFRLYFNKSRPLIKGQLPIETLKRASKQAFRAFYLNPRNIVQRRLSWNEIRAGLKVLGG
jgi:anaerobic magnesium-protoporphyrin IX monomethyl ester cyclase